MGARVTRVGVVACSLVFLLGTLSPPARADTTLVVEFVATVTVTGGGFGYPLLTLPTVTPPHVLPGTPDMTAAHLAGGTVGPSTCLPLNDGLPPDGFTNCHWTFEHVRTLAVFSVACFDVATNVDKLGKAPMHAGACFFATVTTPALPNTVSGHCGLASGQFTLLFTDALLQTFLFDLHFHAVLPKVVFSGHWVKLSNTTGQHGLVTGKATVLSPDPVNTPGESCTTKTAANFLVAGSAVAVTSPTL
jgi:hypothetical protein